jgi:hypothetical protein
MLAKITGAKLKIENSEQERFLRSANPKISERAIHPAFFRELPANSAGANFCLSISLGF